jgi:hypothetical protein
LRVVCFRKRAARCYESWVLTGDDSEKSFEQRDSFVSITNSQMLSGGIIARLCYKAFAETNGLQRERTKKMTQDGVAIWLGIDWADQKHRWAMRIKGETRIQQGELEHTPEAVEQFVAGLAIRFPGQRVAVALEQSRGALIFMLGKYE